MNKTHWKKLNNPDYLGAYALDPDKDLVVLTKNVKQEVVTGPDGKKEECTVMYFSEKGIKPMILNVTNAKVITKLLDTPYIEDWAGHKVAIYIAEVKAFGELVDALRIRPKLPNVKRPALTPESKKWADAVKSLRDGTIDIDGIKQYVSLSAEHEELLIEQSKSQEESPCRE